MLWNTLKVNLRIAGERMNFTYVDAHCDTLTTTIRKGERLWKNTGQLDIKRLLQFPYALQFMAIWMEPQYYQHPFIQTCKVIEHFYKQLEQTENHLALLLHYSDFEKQKESGNVSVLLSLEGGEALEGELSNVSTLYRLGVRSMSLTWNFQNALASGSSCEDDTGLTSFGKQVVQEMNRLGMILDVSHLSEKSFWDVTDLTKEPFIASHSNAKAICSASRNLSDAQIKTIGERGGVIGLTPYPAFLGGKTNGIDRLMTHLNHIYHIGGENAIGIGCDFDGIEKSAEELEDVSCIKPLLHAVEKRYGFRTAEKFAGGNFLRILKDRL